MKRIFILLVFVLALIQIKAQKENNNWHFGKHAGLSWNTTQDFQGIGMWGTSNTTLTNIPTIIPSSIDSYEGCFSLSDANGDLLFYSDGITIWNREGEIMENGTNMSGDYSSAQSGIIIPFPETPNKYITFTLGYGNHDNLSYSVIDMTLDDSKGAVLGDMKNIRLTGHMGILGETLTAVRHANRDDFWLVAAGRGNPAYINIWKVDKNGVSITPHQRYNTNLNIPSTFAPGGYIAFSQTGDRYVWNNYNWDVESPTKIFFTFGEFDNEAGLIKNLKRKNWGTSIDEVGNGYGVAFSKSGNYVYVSGVAGDYMHTNASSISIYTFQHLLDNDPESIYPIRTIHANPNALPNDGINDHFAAMGTGPDGRIYISHPWSNNLYVINNPEAPASLQIYKLINILGTETYPYLNNPNNRVGKAGFGLPTASAPWFRFQIIPPPESIACNKITTTYDLKVYGGEGFDDMKYITVDFGEDKEDSKITIQSPQVGTTTLSYTYYELGEYTITIRAYDQSDKLMQGMEKSSIVRVKSCALPVNPNIH